ncbi:hypothetical protein WJX72_001304 [[Myrmecia] bisecta]|uniref:BZIP domain-containing protein n=1 Tax=[Myrmecia] bisecta TaxID=41462 RepID=A0AAW1PE91_9CHLO
MSQPWQQQQHDLQGGRPHLAGTDDLNPQHPYHPGQVGPSGQPEWPTWAPRVQYGAGRGAGVSQRGRYGAQKWRGGGSYGHAESDPSSWQSGQAGVSAPGRQVHSGSPHLGQHGPQPPPPAEQSMESDAARPVSAGGGVGPAGGASGGPQGRGQGRMSGGQGQGGGRGRGDGSALGTMQAGEQRVVYGPTGEVLPRRVVANRQSAQRSRLRKLQYIADLEATCEELRADIDGMEPQLDFLATRCTGVAQENNMLAAHLGDLNHEVRCKDALNQGLYDEIRRLRGVALTGAYSAPAVAEGRFLQPQPPREPQASQPTVKEEQEVTAHSFSREPPQLSSGGLQAAGAARPQLRRPGEPATQLAAVRAAEPAAQQGQHGQQDDRWQQADQVVPELPASPPTSISNATDPGRLGSPGH